MQTWDRFPDALLCRVSLERRHSCDDCHRHWMDAVFPSSVRRDHGDGRTSFTRYACETETWMFSEFATCDGTMNIQYNMFIAPGLITFLQQWLLLAFLATRNDVDVAGCRACIIDIVTSTESCYFICHVIMFFQLRYFCAYCIMLERLMLACLSFFFVCCDAHSSRHVDVGGHR